MSVIRFPGGFPDYIVFTGFDLCNNTAARFFRLYFNIIPYGNGIGDLGAG
jgi:hypothetical protein